MYNVYEQVPGVVTGSELEWSDPVDISERSSRDCLADDKLDVVSSINTKLVLGSLYLKCTASRRIYFVVFKEGGTTSKKPA